MGTKLVYSSQNKSVATVDKNGKITAKNPGTTFIDVKSGKMEKHCAVTVMSRDSKDEVITFKEKSNTTYVSKWKFKNKSKYILAIHPDTYLPNDFEKKLDDLIARIEKTSKLQLHPKKKRVQIDCDKPIIWVGGKSDTLGNYYGVNIRSADIALKDETALTVGRWIANCIIYRNNTYMGEVFGSSYGTTIARYALEGSSLINKNYNILPEFYETYDKEWDKITSSKMKGYLSTQNLQSDTEQNFPDYLYKKYGAAKLIKVMNKINAENKKKGCTHAGSVGISAKRCLAICESYTSSSVVEDYTKEFKKKACYAMGPLANKMVKYKAKDGDIISVYAKGYNYAEYYNLPDTSYTGSITYDFTEAMQYFTVNCGQKVTGLYGVGFVCGEEMTLELYDKNDHLLNTITDSGRIDVFQDGAVKVKVSGNAGWNGFILLGRTTNFNKYSTLLALF